MGFRFRKSKNLGGGFRLNFSKSGIGGSWGVKGFRATKKAKGGLKTTVSIPGTSISYSTSSKKSSESGCVTIFIVWPIKLVLWMVLGCMWLMFVFPFKCLKAILQRVARKKEVIQDINDTSSNISE